MNPIFNPTRTPSPFSTRRAPTEQFILPIHFAAFDTPFRPYFYTFTHVALPTTPISISRASMAIPVCTMNLKYPKYANALHQDLDDHCIMFEETYFHNNPYANPLALTADEQLQMKRTFTTTMIGLAQAWVTQYMVLNHIPETQNRVS